MDELVDLVAGKVGDSNSQVKKVINTVMDFLDKKLPSALDNQVRQALEGA